MTDDNPLNGQTAATIVQINATSSRSERGLITAAAYETVAQAVVLGQSRIGKQQACISSQRADGGRSVGDPPQENVRTPTRSSSSSTRGS